MEAQKTFSVKEVAERLNISQQTVRRLIKAGDIKVIQITDSLMRIAQEDLDEFIAARKS